MTDMTDFDAGVLALIEESATATLDAPMTAGSAVADVDLSSPDVSMEVSLSTDSAFVEEGTPLHASIADAILKPGERLMLFKGELQEHLMDRPQATVAVFREERPAGKPVELHLEGVYESREAHKTNVTDDMVQSMIPKGDSHLLLKDADFQGSKFRTVQVADLQF